MDTLDKGPDVEILASLLERYSVGVGRITPGPRGSRLSGEPRRLLEAAADGLSGDEIDGSLMVWGQCLLCAGAA